MELRGKTALVTGGAKRIGRCIALALGAEGMRVAVHHRSSPEEAAATAREIGDALPFQADLTDAADIERLVGEVTSSLGDLRVLINSASVFEPSPWPLTDEAWERNVAIHMTAPMRLVRAATPGLQRERGVVVNIIDAVWSRPSWPRHTAYCVSKAGLAALTQSLARALAPEIRVVGVAPGAVLPPDDYSGSQRDAAVRRVPLVRWGTPDDVAQAVVALARSDYITGQILAVDGGQSIC